MPWTALCAGFGKTTMSEQTLVSDHAPLLVIAALRRELAGFKKLEENVLFLATGEGPENAERGLRSFLQNHRPQCVMGIGFAGSLSKSLQAGDLVVGQRILGTVNLQSSAPLVQLARNCTIDHLYFGTIVETNTILWQAVEKRELSRRLPANEIGCVDMESSAVAQVCDEASIPFLAVRCITDLLDEDLPLDFNRCRNRSGRLMSTKVLVSTLLRPSSIRGLMELRRRSVLCASRLAAFVRAQIFGGCLAQDFVAPQAMHSYNSRTRG